MTDLLVRLLRSGYGATERDRQARGGGNAFRSRLAGRGALVVRGPAGARLFYDESLIRRKGAIPFPLRGLLFGRGAIHGLDGDAHKERKQLFFDVLSPDRVRDLVTSAATRLEERVHQWGTGPVQVHDELVEVYGTTVIEWAGIPCSPGEAARWSREMARIVDGFGGDPKSYPRAWVARLRCDRWARRQVQAARRGSSLPPAGSALAVLAHSDLDETTAAVELLNLLRPTIAVSWLGAFAALYLDEAPQWRTSLRTPTTGTHHVAFAQEVRRSAPFVPVLAGKVRKPASHQGVEVRPGQRVVLDVWGTDQAADEWEHPERFDPTRFLRAEPGPYDFVPQGGGQPTGHRCPGEPLTISLLAETVRVLAGVDGALVSGHDVDLTRMPTLPEEGARLAPHNRPT